MHYYEDTRILITGAKDKSIKVWQLPERWRPEEIDKFEESEIKNQKDSIAMLKIQKSLSKKIEDDDSENELDGWDIR